MGNRLNGGIFGGGHVILTCMCCGISQTFADGQAAFEAGWDGPPHFTNVVACNLCPSSFIVLNCLEVHTAAHERWQKEGRPANFLVSMQLGDVPLK